jgi:effector-binding domain-containing protein
MTAIQIVELEQQCTATIHDHVAMDQMSVFFGRALAAVSQTLAAEGVTPTGPPFACYHGRSSDVVEVEAGFPVADPVPAADAVWPGVLPGGRAMEALHVGPYDELHKTYAAIQERIEQEGLEPADLRWECYLTDPESEPDPSRWQTQIIWPIREHSPATP